MTYNLYISFPRLINVVLYFKGDLVDMHKVICVIPVSVSTIMDTSCIL